MLRIRAASTDLGILSGAGQFLAFCLTGWCFLFLIEHGASNGQHGNGKVSLSNPIA
jgi:hypothetical protein